MPKLTKLTSVLQGETAKAQNCSANWGMRSINCHMICCRKNDFFQVSELLSIACEAQMVIACAVTGRSTTPEGPA